MSLRVGIISANWGTFAHLPAWQAVPGVEVVAVCTSRRETAEAAAARHGIPHAFWDAQAMAADPRIDIIDCGTRPIIREPHVLAGLRHGKHIYNGIPFAADLAGARKLHQAWQASGTVGVVDAFSAWIPAHRMAREMLDAGYLGQPFGGTCIFNMGLFNPLQPGFPYNWFAQAGQGVSALRNLGSHALHMLVWMLGEVEELVAHDGQLLAEWQSAEGGPQIPVGTNDFATLILRFRSGMTIQCQVSWNATLGPGWMLDIFGSQGRMVAQAPSFPTARDTTLQAGPRGGRLEPVELPSRLFHAPGIGIDADFPVAPSYPMALSMNAMARAIEGKDTVHPDFSQAWQVERILEAARLSQLCHAWVRLNDID